MCICAITVTKDLTIFCDISIGDPFSNNASLGINTDADGHHSTGTDPVNRLHENRCATNA